MGRLLRFCWGGPLDWTTINSPSVAVRGPQVQQVQRARADMDGSGIPRKTSSQEEHAMLSTKLFDRCCAPASQALCLRGRGRAKLKELCTQPGLLFLTACLQQGSDKDKEEKKPREADEEGGGTPLKPSGQD